MLAWDMIFGTLAPGCTMPFQSGRWIGVEHTAQRIRLRSSNFGRGFRGFGAFSALCWAA